MKVQEIKQRLPLTLATAALAAVMAFSLAACGQSTSSDSNSGSSDSTQTTGANVDENGIQQVNVTLEDNECKVDVTEVEAGPVTFNVTNVSAPAINEFEVLYNQKIIGEKENLAPGLDTVSFTITMDGGDYRLYAPGAGTEFIDFKVTGEAAAAPTGSTQEILAQGVTDYAEYIAGDENGQIPQLLTAVQNLQEKLKAGDIEEARVAYVEARPYYERAESAVDGFIKPGGDPEDNNDNLDYLIDMRESNYDDTAGWHGFHAIEQDLWEDEKITDETLDYAAELVENVTTLKEEVVAEYTSSLKPEDLANGAAGLLEEVATSKISGEEQLYSHTDLVDFRANVEGAQQAYANLRDGLLQVDEDLVERIDSEFEDLIEVVDSYRADYSTGKNYGGFVAYDEALQESDSAKLAAALQPVYDDVASLAAKVVSA